MDTRRSLRRELKETRADLRAMTEDRNRQRSHAATHLSNLARVAEQYGQAHDEATRLRSRLHRVLRACARYRVDAATQTAVTARLTEQLFDSLGYDDVLRARLSPDPAAALVGEVTR